MGRRDSPPLTQLTANPPDLPVTSARISPDGKYLAYADPDGHSGPRHRHGRDATHRRHARNGCICLERRRDKDSRRGVRHGNMHRLGSLARRRHPTPLRGCLARDRCRDLYARRFATPEDQQGSRDLSVDPLDGSAPRHLVDLGPNGSASWSADGERVLFTRGPALSAVESMPLAGGSSSVVFKAPDGQRIADTGLQLRDGRLLTLLSDAETNVVAVWEVPIDGSSGVARGSPRRLTEWRSGGSSIGRFSVGVRAGSGCRVRRRMESVSS